MEQYDHRVDEYIGKKPAFAQPILNHLRKLVHEVSPSITETIKWGCPFFEYKGTLCNMAAFKEHCAFGFWNASSLKDTYGVIHKGEDKDSAGSFGRLTTFSDLPGDAVIQELILQAMALNEKGGKSTVKKAPVPKAEIPVPDYFTAALGSQPKAQTAFEAFSPSHKREYLEWIVDAKTEATRQKRIETALE